MGLLKFGLSGNVQILAQGPLQAAVKAQRPNPVVQGQAGLHAHQDGVLLLRIDSQGAAVAIKRELTTVISTRTSFTGTR
jgi:hypothetical protein